MKRFQWLLIPLLLVFVASSTAPPAVAAQRLSESELQALPGYVDFGDVWKFSDGDQEVEIELTQPLLSVVAPFLRAEDPELADLILDLHLVRVNAFDFDRDDRDEVLEMMRSSAEKLRGDEWDNIVKVRGDDENVNVFVRIDGDGSDPSETYLDGLAVLVVDHGEAAFVNVVGRFRMEDIARIGAHFDLPHSGDWSQMKEQMEEQNQRRNEGNQR